MLSVDEALARILAQVTLQPAEDVPLAEAYGRVLAEDLVSPRDVPPWDNSAMDGYAVRAADTAEDAVDLTLLETIGAGRVGTRVVGPGTASGIMTGAPLPEGADAVVMVEDSDGAREGVVRIRGRATVGQHLRRRGDDVRAGERVLVAGHTLDAAAVGLAGSLGLASIRARRRPRVALLSTGDEVVPPGQALGPGQIYSSNNATLAGLVLAAGAVPIDHGIAPDDPNALQVALEATLDADVVVTTGGVSVGAYDFVKETYAAIGVEMGFWKVRMKPGKPLAFGRCVRDGRAVPLFGLPGNPVSCMVNFQQFVRPWLRLALGDPRPYLPVLEATLADDFPEEKPGRARLVRVALSAGEGGWIARSTGNQSSGVLTSMVRCDGLMLLSVDAPPPRAGDRVRVQVLSTRFLDGETPGYGW